MLTTADYIEIQNLIHSYAKRIDGGDLEGMGQLFLHAEVYFDGVAEPVVKDPSTITAMYRDFMLLYEGKPRTRHIMSNLILEEDEHGDVIASSTLVVFQQTDTLSLQPIITGDYEDRLGRIDGRWQFLERRISTDLHGNLSAHGKHDIAT